MTDYVKRIMLMVAMALVVPLGSLGGASSAQATPGGVFAVFADCPLAAIRALGVPPGRALCGFHQITSGELVIGGMDVPIDRTITLQGGFIPTNPETEIEFFGYPPENGESLSKTELNVPGGLPGLIDCREIQGMGFWEKFERGECVVLSFYGRTAGVTATIEAVAGTAHPLVYNERSLAHEEGTALILPIRVHLKNPLLGSGCYIGSESNPIELDLTTGATSPLPPNKSIHGAEGNTETLEEDGLLTARDVGNSLVDNTFSAPTAEGCGESLASIIDPILDRKIKLPSEDGYNTAVLTGVGQLASAEEVGTSEKIQAETEAKKKQEEAEAKKKQEEAEAKKKQEEAERRHRRHWPHWRYWQAPRSHHQR